MKVYISGPMTGYPELNFPAFEDAAKKLRDMGYTVISPNEIEQLVKTWEACMREDIKKLMDAGVIVTLDSWENSAGATIEVELGRKLGMRVYTLSEILEKGGVV